MREVRPLLKLYITAPAPVPMDTDLNDDFDPLSRKTTWKMLLNAIAKKYPEDVPAGATIDDLLILYKHCVDPALKLPASQRFTERPRSIAIHRLKSKTMEDLLLALRYHAPQLFVRSLSMNKATLIDLYIEFVHNEKPSKPLVQGFHYTILDVDVMQL